MKRRRYLPCVMLAVSLCSAPVLACSVSATSLQFGTIDPLLAADTGSTSLIAVTCPELTSYVISLSSGAGSYAERIMQSGDNQLVYNLYIDASYSNIWGDGTDTSQTVNGTASTEGSNHTVYGRVPHQPRAVPGTYSDSIIVTVTF